METGTGEVSNRYTSKDSLKAKEIPEGKRKQKHSPKKTTPTPSKRMKGGIPKNPRISDPREERSLNKTFSQPKLVDKKGRTQDAGEEA